MAGCSLSDRAGQTRVILRVCFQVHRSFEGTKMARDYLKSGPVHLGSKQFILDKLHTIFTPK